jgi:hypothetical protein
MGAESTDGAADLKKKHKYKKRPIYFVFLFQIFYVKK